ncbi:MAG: Flp pilus assembly complex ATPase component TadA, partial [Deltaproteobacteria bacterium]|nr:Flp pilus assembly complex ATPase component TadA [Deltaproteobacteria bacterium]
MPLDLQDLLKTMIEHDATDLHITTGTPPQIRVYGRLVPLDLSPLTGADTKRLAYSVLTDAQKHRFEEEHELDFSFGIKGLSRFRGNLFFQRGVVAAAIRSIPYKIRGFKDLGLPAIIEELIRRPKGLVLVTGPTGCGKSTTQAAM